MYTCLFFGKNLNNHKKSPEIGDFCLAITYNFVNKTYISATFKSLCDLLHYGSDGIYPKGHKLLIPSQVIKKSAISADCFIKREVWDELGTFLIEFEHKSTIPILNV